MERLCGRPSNFEELICNSWKNYLKPEDTMIHLGDVCFRYNDGRAHKQWIQPMPGKKILVRGNHDKKSSNWYTDNGWDFVCDDFSLRYKEHKLKFTHIPVKEELREPGILYISGHEHQNAKNSPNQYVISLELQGYYPIMLDSVLRIVLESNR
jgi:calcineurin-like phosphoesterase family protein